MLRVLACVVPGVCLLMVNLCGMAEVRLSNGAEDAVRRGYTPSPEDYSVAVYRHGFPFCYLTRYVSKEHLPLGTPVPPYPPEFLGTSSRWAINDAMVVSWSRLALIGNAGFGIVTVWGIWFLVPVLLARTNVDNSATPHVADTTTRTPLLHQTLELRWFIALVVSVPTVLAATLVLLRPVVTEVDQSGALPAVPPLIQNTDNSDRHNSIPNPPVDPDEPIVPREHLPGNSAGESKSDNMLGLSLVWCPPGSFTGKVSEDWLSREELEWFRVADSSEEVSIKRGFWISQCEVTQRQWQRIMGDNPSFFTMKGLERRLDTKTALGRFRLAERQKWISGVDTDSLPVESVSWHQAMEFCRQLTLAERQAGRLSESHCYSLPGEAQWELACRADTTTYSAFGNQMESHQANFVGQWALNSPDEGPALYRPAPVGSYAPNRWGICDMHGNVEEWCRESFDSVCPPSGPDRIAWGGSLVSAGSLCQSSIRAAHVATDVTETLGFRVVLTVCPEDLESED